MTQHHEKFVLMGFGEGGNQGHGISTRGNSFSSSWYIKPEDLQTYIDNGHYKPEAMEGCILVNKLPAIKHDWRFALHAPMVKVALQDDDTDRMADVLKDPSSAIVLEGVSQHNAAIGMMAAKAVTDPTFAGLDYVSPTAYARWWRQRGAILGKVENGKVIWDEPQVQPKAAPPVDTQLSLAV